MKTIATLHPIAAAVANIFQAKGDVRYYLNGICIQPRKGGGVLAIATNGHGMVVAADAEGTLDPAQEKGIIVRLDPATVAKCKLLNAEALEIREADGQYFAAVTGVEHVAGCQHIDGKYPDWRAVFPSELPAPEAGGSPAVNAAYLADFGAAAKLLHKRYPGIRLHYKDANSTICVAFNNGSERLTVAGVLMPLRAEDYRWQVEA